MNFRALTLGAMVGFMAAMVPSCGGTTNNNKDGGGGSGGGSGGSGGSAGNSGGSGGSSGCNATNCASGCCSGGTCLNLTSQTAQACGNGGAACAVCGVGQTCNKTVGACQTPDSGVQTDVGKACSADTDCGGNGLTCRKTTVALNGVYQGGYCTKACTTSSPCPMGSSCVSFGGGAETSSLCVNDCSQPQTLTAPECRTPGYACYGLSGGGATGVCWIYPTPYGPPADKVGNACTTHAACQNPPAGTKGVCFGYGADGGQTLTADGGNLFPGGYCTASCGSDSNCSPDGGDAFCLDISSTASACFKGCTPDGGQGGCRANYACETLTDQNNNPVGGACFPACNIPGGSCTAGMTCTAGGLCQ